MHKILLDSICDNMNTLVEAGNFGALSTDEILQMDVIHYILYNPHRIQVETIIDGKIISDRERVLM